MSIDPETERALNDLIFTCQKRNARLDEDLKTAHLIGRTMLDLERLNAESIERIVSTLQMIGAWPRPIEQGPRQNGLAPPPLPSESFVGALMDQIGTIPMAKH